ncbi:MAG: germination protein YpeB [Mahellales bacterium]|jgi:spore germination protein
MKTRHFILPTILTVLLIGVAIWGYNQYTQKQQYHTYMDNLYQKSFYDLIGSVENIQTGLSKLMVASSPNQSMSTLSEIRRHSDNAETNLAQLPISHLALDNTQKYINQLGDYCYFLARNAGEGRPISQEHRNNLLKLKKNAGSLTNQLHEMEKDITAKGIKWGEMRQIGRREMEQASKEIVDTRFKDIEEEMMDYPVLIYDGPFSESIERMKAVGLTGSDINQDEAERRVREFVGRNFVGEIERLSDGNGKIKTWNFQVIPRNRGIAPYNVDISKKGGHIVWMVSSHQPARSNMTIEEAVKRAQEFLVEKGYNNMVPTYKQHFDNIAVVNFAYQQDDVIIYPDHIKVNVSMDNGIILGFEAQSYLMAHRKRDNLEPKLTEEEAREYVDNEHNITSARLAVIPTAAMEERLCYEFKCNMGEDEFLIYINANTGREEKILQLIRTTNGTLAI